MPSFFFEDRYVGDGLGVSVHGRASVCDLLGDILAEH